MAALAVSAASCMAEWRKIKHGTCECAGFRMELGRETAREDAPDGRLAVQRNEPTPLRQRPLIDDADDDVLPIFAEVKRTPPQRP